MSNALFAFEDRDAGRRAVDRLEELGLPQGAIVVHVHDEKPNERLANDIDEQITGGVVSNLYHLFGRLMEWGGEPHDPGPYANVVRDGGMVISVDAASQEQQDRIDALMQDAGGTLHSEWTLDARVAEGRRAA